MALYDPAALGSASDFLRQTDWLGEPCRSIPPLLNMLPALNDCVSCTVSSWDFSIVSEEVGPLCRSLQVEMAASAQ